MNNDKLVRGLRNNNPFNIKKSGFDWLGKVASKDPVFEQFDSLEHGVRAGLKLLLNYVRKGIDTPNKIISRFAPVSENNTKYYQDYIIRNNRGLAFIQPNEHIGDIHTLCCIASRMVKYECKLTSCELCNYMLTANDMERVITLYNLNFDNVL